MLNYTKGTLPDKCKPEPAHWLWGLVGMMLGMTAVSLLCAWLIERLA